MFECHEIGKKLKRHDLGDGQQILRGWSHFDAIADQFSNLRVALIGNGDDASALGLHIGEQLQGLFVAHD